MLHGFEHIRRTLRLIKPLEAAIAALREQLQPPAGSAGMSSMCSFATDLTARSFCRRPHNAAAAPPAAPVKAGDGGNRLPAFLVSAEVFLPGGLSMNSKTVHDIYLEARAMQREGMSARKIAIRTGTLGAESGLAPIRTIGVGDQIDQHFERTGETIWSDGCDWHYSSHD